MKSGKCLFVSILVIISIFICFSPAGAKKLVSEARSVIEGIQKKSKGLSGKLSEFHTEFSARAAKMVELEAVIEELKEKGYLGEKYSDTPEKYERVYAEYARYMSEIKDVFAKYAPLIQDAVSSFNKSIYRGRDRVSELRSDDMSGVGTELGQIKDNFQDIKQERSDLENKCPRGSGQKLSRTCQREWSNYQRKLTRINQRLARLKYMKKMAEIKNSITGKLAKILERYVDKEANTVDMLLNYAFSFEQYAGFIGSKDLGGMLKTIRELSKLEEKVKDFEQFHIGLEAHVGDMGTLVGKRLDHFMQETGMADVNMESRGDALQEYDGQEAQITNMIKELEQG